MSEEDRGSAIARPAPKSADRPRALQTRGNSTTPPLLPVCVVGTNLPPPPSLQAHPCAATQVTRSSRRSARFSRRSVAVACAEAQVLAFAKASTTAWPNVGPYPTMSGWCETWPPRRLKIVPRTRGAASSPSLRTRVSVTAKVSVRSTVDITGLPPKRPELSIRTPLAVPPATLVAGWGRDALPSPSRRDARLPDR